MWVNHCTRVQACLPLLASGELRGLDRRRAERHLLICARCRHRLSALHNALSVLHSVADVPLLRPDSPSLWPTLTQQIEESRRPAATWGPFRTQLAGWSAAAAVLGILATTWILRPTSPVKTALPSPPPATKAIIQAHKPTPRIAVPVASGRDSSPKESLSPVESSVSARLAIEPDRSTSVASDTRDTQ
jgi:anti-sigma factor RsiW